MEPITDEDYTCEKSFGKDFEIKHFGECHDLHVQSDTLGIVDVFSNIWNECLENATGVTSSSLSKTS